MVLAILWCTDAFAHGEGKCSQGYRIEHFKPHTEEDPCWERDCAEPMYTDGHRDYEGGHGHINYADIDGSGSYDSDSDDCLHSWGYWVAGIVMNGGNMEEGFDDCIGGGNKTS